MDNVTKICMPAFLPTIQAKTQTKDATEKQTSIVRKYLRKIDLTRNTTPTTPYATQSLPLELNDNRMDHLFELEKSVLLHEPVRAKTQKSQKRKPTKYRSRHKPTGNKNKLIGRVYLGVEREPSSTGYSQKPSKSTSSTRMSYHSMTTPQEELITNFSRISMRHVQATINNKRLALLPSIT